MNKRVALTATLVTFAFMLTVLLLSGISLAKEKNQDVSDDLVQLCRVTAAAIDDADTDDRAVIRSLINEPDVDVEWYDGNFEDLSDRDASALDPEIKEDYALVEPGTARAFMQISSPWEKTLYAIYRFEDGAFLQLSRRATTVPDIFYERRITYIILMAGACLIVYFAVKTVEFRKQHLIDQIMDTLQDFSEGKFDTRIALSKWESAKRTAEYNGVISGIEERIFRQRSRNQALSVVINQMQNGIIAVDEEMKVMLVTPLAKRLLGIVGNAEGLPLGEISKDVNLVPLFTEAMQQAGVYTNEVAARTAVGRGHRPLRLYVSSMRQDGRVVGALAMIEDITELRRLEQLRTDFAANVSHELKTPLTSIKGFVETLLDGAIRQPEMAEKFLKIIMLEADRLTRLINDILSITKLESGADEVGIEPIRLDKMAFEVADMLRIHAGEKGVTINARLNDKPVYVMGNPDRTRQMLINLVENAIKYNKQNGSVTVLVFANDREINMSISDTGIGIAEEHLPRLFERFYRVDKGRSRSMGGTGLGLAIVKHIIRSMKGEIEVHSKLGEGTEFLITLPLAPREEVEKLEESLAGKDEEE